MQNALFLIVFSSVFEPEALLNELIATSFKEQLDTCTPPVASCSLTLRGGLYMHPLLEAQAVEMQGT